MTTKKSLLATALLVAGLWLGVPQAWADEAGDFKPCHWWNRNCAKDGQRTEELPPNAPHTGTVITIDVSTNTAYLFIDGQLVRKSPAATGSEKILIYGGDVWLFRTPRGRMKVLRKIQNPVWRKPDWAFLEDREPIPPPDSPKPVSLTARGPRCRIRRFFACLTRSLHKDVELQDSLHVGIGHGRPSRQDRGPDFRLGARCRTG